MTRKEEIHEIANTIDPIVGKEIDEDYNCADVYDFTIGFECGAKWADETMIEKACEWLTKGGYFVNSNETIEDFRKAMEE